MFDTYKMPTEAQANRMREVFGLVKPQYPFSWKGEIEAEVAKDRATKQEIIDAVVFMAGGVPTIVDVETHWYVTGAGYWVWIGA